MFGRALIAFALMLSIVTAPGGSRAAPQVGVSEFRGYIAVNRLLVDRLFNPGSKYELGSYVGQSYDSMSGNLLDLLGTYKTGFGVGGFRNGRPNALNMLLWHLLFSELARDIARLCGGENALAFNPSFVATVQPLCAWPSGPAARTGTALLAFWMAIMGYDAPVEEYQTWETFALGQQMVGLQGAEAVEGLALSILNNPYFLLRQ